MTKRSPRGASRPRAQTAPQSALRYDVQVMIAQAYESDLPAIHAFLTRLYAEHAETASAVVYLTTSGG